MLEPYFSDIRYKFAKITLDKVYKAFTHLHQDFETFK